MNHNGVDTNVIGMLQLSFSDCKLSNQKSTLSSMIGSCELHAKPKHARFLFRALKLPTSLLEPDDNDIHKCNNKMGKE